MALEKIRRFVFVIAAVVLFLSTVLPNIGVNVSMADMIPGAISVSNSMACPSCATDMMKFGSGNCLPGSCIGFAVIAQTDPLIGSNHQAFFELTTIRPEELTVPPPTPPI